MSNYLSDIVRSNFGDKNVVFATLIMDDGSGGDAVVTGMDQISHANLVQTTAGDDSDERWSVSGGSLTVTTASSGTSFKAMIVGR